MSNNGKASPQLDTFTSRLHFHGKLGFDSAHRIGAERTMAVDAPDLPVLRTQDGRPYIPGSSFKGAWRAYTEAMLRTVQAQYPQQKLACNPLVDKERCFPNDRVREIKTGYRADPDRTQAELDEALRDGSCWTCRVFGNGVVSSKVMIKDLMVDEESFLRTEIRDGVGIDRDTGRVAVGPYQYEVVPTNTQFQLEIIVENASPEELGLVMMGLNAFQRGDILLGGNKSRGLGWCRLQPDWENSRYVTSDTLLDYLFTEADAAPGGSPVDDERVRQWLQAFRDAITGAEEE